MGLMPDQFWALEMREFWMKFDAFKRAEDRARSLMLEHAAIVAPRKKKSDQNAMVRTVNALRRYPEKPWLK
jgi:hypothetical protein